MALEKPVGKPKNFYEALDAIQCFENVVNLAGYVRAPADWWVATADVKGSTKAIESGQYKGVNAAGAACITAIINAVERKDIPFVFGGDGATALIPGEAKEQVLKALAGVQQMAQQAFELELRVGLVSVASLLDAGQEVLVARYGISDHAALACFGGNGAAEAENRLKAGEALVPHDAIAAEADLTGFECRWSALPSRHGKMLSIIVQSQPQGRQRSEQVYEAIVRAIHDLVGGWENAKPVHASNLNLALAPFGGASEVRAKSHHKGGLWRLWQNLQIWISNVFFTALRVWGGNNNVVRRYVDQTVLNSDFQKFDGCLRMVLDLTEPQTERLKAYLQSQYEAGEILYGVHAANSALMTCMVFNHDTEHIHFIDGNDGGYALAAKQLKAQLKQLQPTAA